MNAKRLLHASLLLSTLAAPLALSRTAFAQSTPVAPGSILPADFCSLGEHSGIDEADAQTSASIVCEEVRRHPNLGQGRTYRVQLYKLGQRVFLSVQSEQPAGTLLDKRQMQLAQIEEVPVVAPRLVKALLENKTLQETETVTNIAGEDTRVRKKKAGEVMVGLGLAGTFVPGVPTVGPGFLIGLQYEADAFAIGSELRFSGAETSNKSFTTFTWGLGARWFPVDSDVTPVLGGGLQAHNMSLSEDGTSGYSGGFSGSKFGVGGYGEAGIEALRTHRVRFLTTLRADLPFYSVEQSRYNYNKGTSGSTTDHRDTFTVPLSINAAVYFKW